MALSDLANELPKDTFKLDGGDSEKKICTSIVQLLDDSSGDVQGLAVKWYSSFFINSLFFFFFGWGTLYYY